MIRDKDERSLVAAMLRQAIDDCGSFNMKIQIPAREWINDNQTCPMTYLWCCEVLDLDYNVCRTKINQITFDKLNPKFRRHYSRKLAT